MLSNSSVEVSLHSGKHALGFIVKKYYWFWVVLLSIFLGFIFWRIELWHWAIGQRQMLDLHAYYVGIHEISEGISPFELSVMQTAGPPLVLVPYVLLLPITLQQAQFGMTFISLVASFWSCWLLATKFFPSKKVLAMLALATVLFLGFPARFTVEMGQSNAVLLFLTTVLVVGRGRWTGMLAGTMAVIKTNYLAVVPYLWYRPRQLLFALLSIVFIALLGTPFLSIRTYQEYFSTRFLGHVNASSIQGYDYYNQSLQSTLHRLTVPESYWIFLALLAIVWLYSSYKKYPPHVGVYFALLLSPIIWQHYFMVLFPLFIVLVFQKKQTRMSQLLIIISYALTQTHLPILHMTSQPQPLIGLVASHQFFGLLGMMLLAISMEKQHRVDE